MLRLHAEVSGKTATYAPFPRVVGQKVVLGTIFALVEKSLIRVVRLYITTSTRGSEGPSFQMKKAHPMRMKCVGWTVGVSKSSISAVTG
jgi:hypothetical protein